ncbi:MAG TPA: cbb3-type cytochrome c oxidase subunit I [Gemmatimonadales bacterium]|nr:cbb3-type cytochrome c oxidase subunit I [Gemmatimonadales bacterium]
MTSVAHAKPAGSAHDAHHAPMSFWRKYIFSTDHKIIGIQFLFVSLFFLLLGGLLAMQIRWQLGFPGKPMPGGGILPESMVQNGVILPEYYIQLVTMHGTFMVFFAIMPLLVGVYANFLIPLKIGTHDMAFPRINMWSFWLALLAGTIMLAGFFVPDGAPRAGWTMYAPLSARPDLSGATYSQKLWSISIVILGLSSVMGSVNYITTIINLRAPGMTWFRMPLSVWALFITAILAVLALPVLQGAAILLLFDQTIGTHFFDPVAGGQALLWQHLFWFFGHPEVYILILPAMGMASDIVANGSRKPIFGYHSMVFAIIGIAFLGWVVWGHHMFMSGMNPTLGSTFMVSTLLIAVPSAIKVFNWLGTMWRGNLRFHVPMLNAIGFVSMFTIGGLSGIFMAATPVDIPLHDTQFIVAHIHYVLFGGSLFALFAAIPYWYPKMFGRMMSERIGKVHFFLTFIFYNMTFFPMHIIGMGGQMRRIYDPTVYDFLKPQQPLNEFISYSAFALFAVQILFAFNFLWSLKFGKKAPQNPWEDNGMEWSLPNPAPHGNWERTPNVYRGPYEFSAPEAGDKDYLPQYLKLPTDRDPVPAPLPAGGH